MSQNNIIIKYKDTVLLQDSEIESVASSLSDYLGTLKEVAGKTIYDVPESFLSLPDDKELFQKSEEVAGIFANLSLKYIIVAGIGGSNLGAAAIYDALYPKFDGFLSKHPKLLFSDTNNPREMELLKKIIEENVHEPKEIVLNIITKSGTTVETIANAMVLFETLSLKFGEQDAIARTVVTTDEESSLWKIALEKGIQVLPVPKKIGGRYSVFSPVGIFPLSLAGINVAEFLSGAGSVRDSFLSADLNENPALLSSSVDFLVHQKGLSIYNSFFFNSELESVGKWGRQLFAESLGKKNDKEGKTVYSGMTPVVSVGTTDLHSMVQLYLGGPKDKFTNFIHTDGTEIGRVTVPVHSIFDPLVSVISGKDFQKLMSSNLGGTMEAYKENSLPFVETILPGMNERSLGQYCLLKMIETVLLGKLWNINPFDQPEVESYKKIARELLKKQ